MSHHNDAALEIAVEGAAAGLQDFQATLAAFQNRPNPNPALRPVGGVPLPHMGTRPVPPQTMARPGAPQPPAAHAAASMHLRSTADQIALQTMMEARRDFVPNLFKGASIRYKSGRTPA